MNSLRGCGKLMRFPKQIEAHYSTERESLKLEKVLLLNKLSRLELERLAQPNINDLKKDLKNKGIEYETLVKDDKVNKDFQERVLSAFKQFGITVKNVNRLTCSTADIDWCDAVFPIGGDGTFLHTARYIPDRKKPVIGFNSDPSRSEGFLCLPRKYSSDIPSAIAKLIEGRFKWMYRTRIRINFFGSCPHQAPTELHAVKNQKSNLSNVLGKGKTIPDSKSNQGIYQKLPVLALNEVFMSEIFAAKVSYFEMRLNNSEKSVRIKSSGLCICTGTGSTSWNLSINRLSSQDIHDILNIYIEQTNGKVPEGFDNLVARVSNSFNERLKFGPEERIMGYTIRDLISLGVWPNPKGLIEPRGFANTVEVKSKCIEAGLIVDGGISFPFNEGSVAVLETRPEDALKTVVLLD